MAKKRAFLPNLFLRSVGVSETRPAWFVMLLAAMVTAAVYVAAWIAFALFLITQGTEWKMGPAVTAILVAFIWGEATLWYHLVYLAQWRFSNDEERPERHVEIWGDLIFMAILALLKLIWICLKYIMAPLIPCMLVFELLKIPGIGDAVCSIACILLALYPVFGVAAYIVSGRIGNTKAQEAAGRIGDGS